MVTRSEILEKIQTRGSMSLGTVVLKVQPDTLPSSGPEDENLSSSISFSMDYQGKEYLFSAEITVLSTPRAIETAVARIERMVCAMTRTEVRYPTVIAPYLSEKKLKELAEMKVSGLDLCGNGVLVADGLFVFVSGKKNLYPRSTKLRNIYSRKTSIVARAMVMQGTYPNVKSIMEFINNRNGKISFAIVSKALKQLEEDIFISRKESGIEVVQPESILYSLQQNYKPPHAVRRWMGRSEATSLQELALKLQEVTKEAGGRYSVTGAYSAGVYTGFGSEPVLSCYVDVPIEPLIEKLPWETVSQHETRFVNLNIVRTEDDWVYFDTTTQNGILVASRIQTYLELAAGDPRQQKAAREIRDVILKEMEAGNDGSLDDWDITKQFA